MLNLEFKFNYSFIIPHKNCPELLQRCIDSIPVREDIEIIVVDDNSDEKKKPTIRSRRNLSVILLEAEHSNGAGRARNVGLEHANGKWVLFADADDFYVDDFCRVLDYYSCANDVDVCYFDYYTCDKKGENKRAFSTRIINSHEILDRVKFTIKAPWNKMVLKAFISKHNIHFEEVPNGNDVFYSYQVGYLSANSILIDSAVYIYTVDSNGITNRKNNDNGYYLCQLHHLFQSNEFFGFVNRPEWKRSLFLFLLSILKKKGLRAFVQAMGVWLQNRRDILSNKYFFVSHFISSEPAKP